MNLSIIVPMYNVEKYIAKCIESIVNQLWKELTYEIIIVNDASPDNSLDIALEFQTKYSNIKIVSQENKGLGGARNTGIYNAQGNYLFFLDSDDFLINDELPHLASIAMSNNLDVLEFAASRVDDHYKFLDTIFHASTNGVKSSGDYLSSVEFANSACNKLYRRKFLLENNVLFFEKTLIEDAPFNVEALSKAKRIMAVDRVAVAYLQNPNSITRGKKTKEKQIKLIEDSIKVTHHIALFSDGSINTEANHRIKAKVATFVSGIILMIIKADISKTNKIRFIDTLEKLDLYPYYPKSNFLIRTIFMKFMNQKKILMFILNIKNK